MVKVKQEAHPAQNASFQENHYRALVLSQQQSECERMPQTHAAISLGFAKSLESGF
jgi:hypothetical protein